MESYEENSEICSIQSHWLQTTISCVNEKMKTIMKLLEDNDSATNNTEEIYEKRKDEITKIVKQLCISYCSLAQDYDLLINTNAKHKDDDVPVFYDDSPFDVIDSNPESMLDDLDFENEDSFDPEGDDSRVKHDRVLVKGGMKLKFNKLFEENTELQMELVRRNSEKRDVICKLQEQVLRLVAEKDALKRHLSYVERHKPRFEAADPGRKSMRFERFFRCSF
ncbi:hypothetical protein RND81_11G187600 [Saponaria officinalis]|uniref:NAB domain-containing protein n=1 Tax=Saponaria officinalis TaxID=3572 RepID=A0AAW1HQI5_SAPOF